MLKNSFFSCPPKLQKFLKFQQNAIFDLIVFNFTKKFSIYQTPILFCLFADGLSLTFSTSVSFYLIRHGKHPVETSKGV